MVTAVVGEVYYNIGWYIAILISVRTKHGAVIILQKKYIYLIKNIFYDLELQIKVFLK